MNEDAGLIGVTAALSYVSMMLIQKALKAGVS